MTYKTFASFLAAAKPKDEYRYFTGAHLCGTPELEAVRRAYNDGQVTLTQRRNSAGSFDYLAIRMAERRKPIDPFKI